MSGLVSFHVSRFAEAEVVTRVAGDDEVVQHPESQKLSSRLDRLCRVQVLL